MVLGHNGEFLPRYGLWLDTSPECQQAVKGILSEGFDCDVVLKFGARCRRHIDKSFRPVVSLSDYAALQLASNPATLEPEPCEYHIEPNGLKFGCYVREVFFPERFNLRRR